MSGTVPGWQRVLELLSDGESHAHHELYALNVIAHSRVADLRKRGYVIEQWREEDPRSNRPVYFYRLVSSPEPDQAPPRPEETPSTWRRPSGSGDERPASSPQPESAAGNPPATGSFAASSSPADVLERPSGCGDEAPPPNDRADSAVAGGGVSDLAA